MCVCVCMGGWQSLIRSDTNILKQENFFDNDLRKPKIFRKRLKIYVQALPGKG